MRRTELMSQRVVYILVLGFLFFGTVLEAKKKDPICKDLAAFANTVSSEELRSLYLTSRRSDEAYDHSCTHYLYSPGIEFCERYLRGQLGSHGNWRASIADPGRNVARVLSCFGTQAPPEFSENERDYLIESMTGKLSGEAIGVDEDVEVLVEFAYGTAEEPFIKISAWREEH